MRYSRKGSGSNLKLKLKTILDENENKKRGECWEYNVGTQFPVILPDIEYGEITVDVDSPHKGFSIQTKLVGGKLNGKSCIINDKNIEIARLTFVDGVANGPCVLYDNKGILFFEGYFENGYRQGKGREYDRKGELAFEGFYNKGKKLDIIPVKEMKGYWKIVNSKNEVISICQKDDQGNNDGICYFYSNGEIDRISECKNGEEVSILKRFNGKTMMEFVNGIKQYEGGFRDSVTANYPREGQGEEYGADGMSLIYQGHFWNGKRHGEGISYWNKRKVYDGIWLNGYPRKYLIVLESILLNIIGIYSFTIFTASTILGVAGIIITITCIFYWNRKIVYYGMWFTLCHHASTPTLGPVFLSIIFVCSTAFLTTSSAQELAVLFIITVLYGIWKYMSVVHIDSDYKLVTTALLRKNLVVEDNCCNHINTLTLPQTYFESIIIGNNCFSSVSSFKIDGLGNLKSLKIGINSFFHPKRSNIWDGRIANNTNQSFSILNCTELKSIEIGRYSFIEYGGGFELKNLPKLSAIKIGYTESHIVTFYRCFLLIIGVIAYNLGYSPYRIDILPLKWSLSTMLSSICILCFTYNRYSNFEFYKNWTN